MLIPTIVVGVLAIAFLFIGFQKGVELPVPGLKAAGTMVALVTGLSLPAFARLPMEPGTMG